MKKPSPKTPPHCGNPLCSMYLRSMPDAAACPVCRKATAAK